MKITLPAQTVDLEPSTIPTPVELVRTRSVDDIAAIRIFLDGYSRSSRHTVRSYEKECLRFLLWLRARSVPSETLLPSVELKDVNDYVNFLSEPAPFNEEFLKLHGWNHQPFRKALTKQSIKHCLTVLYKMFDALREVRTEDNKPYCVFNPIKNAVGRKKKKASTEEIEQALSEEEWELVQQAIESLPQETERDKRHYHRARWTVQLLYRAYLRRDEAAQLTMGSFQASRDGWNISLIGKGDHKATIIATSKLMDELRLYRLSLGLQPYPAPGEETPAIMAVTGKNKGITDQAIYLICKEIFKRASELIEPTDPASASRLLKASPHWMRHTGVTHSMEAGVNPRFVQAQARHSSLTVTARYDHQRRKNWRAELEKADQHSKT